MAPQPEYVSVQEELKAVGLSVTPTATRGELLTALQTLRSLDHRNDEFVDAMRDLMEIGGRRDDHLFKLWLESIHVSLLRYGVSSPEIDTEEHVGWFYERFEAAGDAGTAAADWLACDKYPASS